MKTRFGLLGGALALALLLTLLLAAGPATARAPRCVSTVTYIGGLAGELDQGDVYPDTPALGNTTIFHWRIFAWTVTTSGNTGGQMWAPLYDWNMVLKDKPGPDYPEDPESLIQGWHYHWFTGVVCGIDVADDDPSTAMEAAWGFYPYYWENSATKMPPKSMWLWTTKGTGVTTPAGVHYITEYWTGQNRYAGKTAIVTWTMADPDFQDVRGKIRIFK